ncbi:MAG: hypothetical protein ACK5LE_03825, partial [Alphaproteobacteria bacterium]
KKSFYYPPLLHRAIDYEEVVSVDYIMAEVRTTQNNQQKTYMRKLLQFVFDHEVMNSEYGGESRNLRIKAQYHSAIPADRQACIFPQPFEPDLLNQKIHQYFNPKSNKSSDNQSDNKKNSERKKDIVKLLLAKPS